MMVRMLQNLSTILEKAAAYAQVHQIDPVSLIEARLAPDMFTLARQVQSAADAAKTCAARLAGEVPPSYPDTEASFAELQDRIAKTIAFVQGFRPDQIEGAEDRTITVPMRKEHVTFRGGDYLTQFVLPNFFFHVTTAYDILRQQGLEIGKRDYLGGL
jgi:hypothetical protein